MYKEEPIRLVGVSINKIATKNNYQISMFDNIKDKELEMKLNHTVDEINKKYKDILSIGIKNNN